MVFLATWVRLGLGKTHVAVRGFTYLTDSNLLITNCYELYCQKSKIITMIQTFSINILILLKLVMYMCPDCVV